MTYGFSFMIYPKDSPDSTDAPGETEQETLPHLSPGGLMTIVLLKVLLKTVSSNLFIHLSLILSSVF